MWTTHAFMDKQKTLLLSVAIFVAVITSVQCQNQRVASTIPASVTKQEGDSVDLLCTFGRSIRRCEFDLPDGTRLKLREDWDNHPEYKYFGTGVENGQCGVSIPRLSRVHEGNFTCRLDLDDGSPDIVGVIPVEIAKEPQNPQLFIRDDKRLQANTEFQAECSYSDGRPPAVLTWFLGNDRIMPREPEYNTQRQDHQNEEPVITSHITRLLSPDDNLKMLICRLDHPAFPNGFTNTSHQLNVNYQPMALSRDDLYISGLEVGRSADIAVAIRSNPRPRLQWTVDGTTLEEGKQTQRYVVNQAEQTEDGRWLAKLTVIDLTLQDTTKTYLLRASNEFGVNDYPIRIGGSPSTEGSGLGVVPIIGISVIALFVLIVVALLVVARVTKRWCFAGDSLHPNSPDSEAQIAPDEDKTHEHYEQHESKVSDDEVEHKAATNGKSNSNGNTSV